MDNINIETTFGTLMDIANMTNNTECKDYLRKCFQEYCMTNNLQPFNPETVIKWRMEKATIDIVNNVSKMRG